MQDELGKVLFCLLVYFPILSMDGFSSSPTLFSEALSLDQSGKDDSEGKVPSAKLDHLSSVSGKWWKKDPSVVSDLHTHTVAQAHLNAYTHPQQM